MLVILTGGKSAVGENYGPWGRSGSPLPIQQTDDRDFLWEARVPTVHQATQAYDPGQVFFLFFFFFFPPRARGPGARGLGLTHFGSRRLQRGHAATVLGGAFQHLSR